MIFDTFYSSFFFIVLRLSSFLILLFSFLSYISVCTLDYLLLRGLNTISNLSLSLAKYKIAVWHLKGPSMGRQNAI